MEVHSLEAVLYGSFFGNRRKNSHIPSMGERPLGAVAFVNRETGGLVNRAVSSISELRSFLRCLGHLTKGPK